MNRDHADSYRLVESERAITQSELDQCVDDFDATEDVTAVMEFVGGALVIAVIAAAAVSVYFQFFL